MTYLADLLKEKQKRDKFENDVMAAIETAYVFDPNQETHSGNLFKIVAEQLQITCTTQLMTKIKRLLLSKGVKYRISTGYRWLVGIGAIDQTFDLTLKDKIAQQRQVSWRNWKNKTSDLSSVSQ